MSAWSDRSPRERILVVAASAIVLLMGGVKLLAAGGDDIALDDLTAPVVSEVLAQQPAAPQAELVDEPPVHPTGPGSRRDPFEPAITSDPGPVSISEAGTSQDPAKVRIDLVEITLDGSDLIAIVDLDDDRWRAPVGSILGDEVKVIELSGTCGIFEQNSSQFELCVGQSVERPRS